MMSNGAPRRWGELLDAGERSLVEAGISVPERTARWLLEDILGVSTAQIIAYPECEASAEQVQLFMKAVRRCQRGEPVQYILGHTDFCGLRLQVTPDVLIPRPETEILVQVALSQLNHQEHPTVVDVGTGSGCVALAIKQARPRVRMVACDISKKALRVAERNADKHGLDIEFVHADITALTSDLASVGPFNLVVSNPPYISDEEFYSLPKTVRDFEPRIALSCGQDALRFYRAIVNLRSHVHPVAKFVLEVHTEYADGVRKFLVGEGFSSVEIHHDLADRPRIVVGRTDNYKTKCS